MPCVKNADVPRLPEFLIVGAAKSGTTSLAAWLDAHPQVAVPVRKELHVFNTGAWRNGPQWYAEQFSAPAGGIAGEATPDYMIYPETVGRMADMVPDAKLIAVIREPIARAYSQFRMFGVRHDLERRDFDTAIAQELEHAGPPPVLDHTEANPRRWEYLARGAYLEQFELLGTRYPRERLLVLLLEDLIEDPVGSFRRTCDFLGIDTSIVPAAVGKAEHAAIAIRRPWLISAIMRLGLWRRAPSLAWRLYDAATEPAPPGPPVRSETIAAMREYYAQRNRDLAAWLGRDLSAWDAPVKIELADPPEA